MSAPKLIVALDLDEVNQAKSLVKQLSPSYCALKIGSELFTHAGPDFVSWCIKKEFRVFLDLKFHDIPTTVARAVKAAANLGVWMVNVHAAGGAGMLIAAKEALASLSGGSKPLLIGVTVLTSQDEQTLQSLGISEPLPQHVARLARLVHEAHLDGVVCSAREVKHIKAQCGDDFLTVTPGIRVADDELHDQIRTSSPIEAKQQGADYLVIGRMLTQHADPGGKLEQLYRELQRD